MIQIKSTEKLEQLLSVKRPRKDLRIRKGEVEVRVVGVHLYEGLAKLLLDDFGEVHSLVGSEYQGSNSPFKLKTGGLYRLETHLVLNSNAPHAVLLNCPDLESLGEFPRFFCVPKGPLSLSFLPTRYFDLSLGFPLGKAIFFEL
jgi:hypothetical protein